MRKPVLTLFYQYNPWQSTIGGIQTIVSSYIKYAPSEFEIRLVGTSNDREAPIGQWQEAEFAGRALQFMPLLFLQDDNVRKLIPTTLRYTAALAGRNFASDFMHFHRIEPAMMALRWSGDKTLFIHNDIHQQMVAKDGKDAILWRRFPQIYFFLEKILVEQFSQIRSCNSDSVKLYQQHYPTIAERVLLTKNTVDPEIFYPLPDPERDHKRQHLAEQLHLPEITRFILFAGRLHPQKDPVLLIRAIAALDEAHVHLLIAGQGELLETLKAEIQQLGIANRISLLGAIQQADLADLHRLASVFVLSSAYEGLPLVALEALACGTPVVTTRCGETPSLLSTATGLVCEERTPQGIATALRQVLSYPEHFPQAACVQAAQPYSVHSVVGAVYSDMLNRWHPKL
jgi:glycosyltransferase involved in cell wall biosynthesis